MRSQRSLSKREVSRAGDHLAAQFARMRLGARSSLVEDRDSDDVWARGVVERWRDEHVGPMLNVYEAVERAAPPLDLGDSTVIAVSYRPKRFESTVEKLTREPGKLADMADIGGVRAVVDTQDDVDQLQERLTRSLDVRRVRDWARNPRSTGYRAVHLHVRDERCTIEVQLRTLGQDGWANVVEEESRMSGVNYKAGEGDENVLAFFRALADLFGAVELGESHPDLAERLQTTYRQARYQLNIPTLLDLSHE